MWAELTVFWSLKISQHNWESTSANWWRPKGNIAFKLHRRSIIGIKLLDSTIFISIVHIQGGNNSTTKLKAWITVTTSACVTDIWIVDLKTLWKLTDCQFSGFAILLCYQMGRDRLGSIVGKTPISQNWAHHVYIDREFNWYW